LGRRPVPVGTVGGNQNHAATPQAARAEGRGSLRQECARARRRNRPQGERILTRLARSDSAASRAGDTVARRVELKVEEVVGGSQVPKSYGIDALAHHISKVLKN
jgi:hypothetical protein